MFKALSLVSTVSALHADYKPTTPLATVTHTCTMGFEIAGEYMGEIEFGVFGNVAPITAKNFLTLCDQKSGTVNIEGKVMAYAGTIFNTIIPGWLVQGGNHEEDSIKGAGSFYGGVFDDENFHIRFDEKPYVLSMASNRPNSNAN